MASAANGLSGTTHFIGNNRLGSSGVALETATGHQRINSLSYSPPGEPGLPLFPWARKPAPASYPFPLSPETGMGNSVSSAKREALIEKLTPIIDRKLRRRVGYMGTTAKMSRILRAGVLGNSTRALQEASFDLFTNYPFSAPPSAAYQQGLGDDGGQAIRTKKLTQDTGFVKKQKYVMSKALAQALGLFDTASKGMVPLGAKLFGKIAIKTKKKTPVNEDTHVVVSEDQVAKVRNRLESVLSQGVRSEVTKAVAEGRLSRSDAPKVIERLSFKAAQEALTPAEATAFYLKDATPINDLPLYGSGYWWPSGRAQYVAQFSYPKVDEGYGMGAWYDVLVTKGAEIVGGQFKDVNLEAQARLAAARAESDRAYAARTGKGGGLMSPKTLQTAAMVGGAGLLAIVLIKTLNK